MTKNIGSIDKLVRFIIAAVAVWASLIKTSRSFQSENS